MPHVRHILEGVQDGDEVGEGLPCSVVGVDDHAQISEVILESDREGLRLHQSRSLEVVFLQQLDHLLLQGVMRKLGPLRGRIQIFL